MRDPRKEERLAREIQRAQLTAALKVRGLFLEPGQPGFNPDALANWQDCSMRTRAALILVQGQLAADRAKQQAATPKVFGMVLMQGVVADHGKWEQMAAEVSRGQAIEAVATPPAQVEAKP